MNLSRIRLLLIFLCFYGWCAGGALSHSIGATEQEYRLKSPDGHLELSIRHDHAIVYSLYCRNKKLLEGVAALSVVENGRLLELGKNPAPYSIQRKQALKNIFPEVTATAMELPDKYNELLISYRGKFRLVFRIYNEGAAYRFETSLGKNLTVMNETVSFRAAGDFRVFFPEEESFFSHNERYYQDLKLSQTTEGKFCSLPMLMQSENGVNVLVTETDLRDYPGLWLKKEGENGFSGIFPPYPLEVTQEKDRHVKVKTAADYIARTSGARTFPWRILAVAKTDGELLLNRLSYVLAPENRLKDISWIKPGKVAWDWFNFNNVYGVDFRAGVNTETYKYFIDFAARYGIEYIILDEGWYPLGDLLAVSPGINMEEILAHARLKNVGVILWVIWKTLDDQLEPALDKFRNWGVRGIKVDFMQRDDQWMVNYYWRIAEAAAKRRLLVDFHGAHKPAGLHRAYPNVLTYEGVRGLEQNKWSDKNTPRHNVTLPFIRMVAGPVDYTPGAMLNAQKDSFFPVWNRPMSMGTRCHQLAMYVIYESPLQMLADSPSNYLREPECMEFLAAVPTVWDETVTLHGRIGEYAAVARRRGNDWYVGVMTGNDPKEIEIDFSFLQGNETSDSKPAQLRETYSVDIFSDGVNADRCAIDYKKSVKTVTPGERWLVRLAPGGGWAARIRKLNH